MNGLDEDGVLELLAVALLLLLVVLLMVEILIIFEPLFAGTSGMICISGKSH